jgi:predicted MPP superfamily phosphohydrolase
MDVFKFNCYLAISNFILLFLLMLVNRKWLFFVASFLFLGVSSFLLMNGGSNMFHLMNLACCAIFLHGGVFLFVSYFILRKKNLNLSKFLLVCFILLELVALDALIIEPNWLETTYYTIESKKIKQDMTIAVMSDFQTDEIGSYEMNVLEEIMEAKPDMILLPGDFIQVQNPTERKKIINDFREALKEVNFSAPMGVYAVRGNVEDGNWRQLFAGLPIRTIGQKQTISLKELNLTGLNLNESGNLRMRVGNPNPNKFHVAFGHVPDFALGKTEADLLIAGHTHGGQVRIPFFGAPITLSHIPREWASGLTELDGGRKLIVSRGIGMERDPAPRLRFLCRPQLVFVELKVGEE